ncbi:nucleoporin Nup186/Nup192/Nup205 [Phakopsora pachyrhizi]|nr:nucleoporin Nup186/Nup192/Nup205 [Phakopsora pachyrhizi]
MTSVEYIPELFLRLSEFLEDLIAKPEQSLLSRLRLELDRAKPHLINLLDKQPRSQKEAELIKKGQFVYQGTLRSHAADFTQEALYLSEQLELSENQCAILLQHGMSRKSRYGRANADSAVIIYYQERSALLRCLKLIFQPIDSEEMRESGISEELERFRSGFVNSYAKASDSVSWVKKVFQTIEQSKQQIEKLKKQLTAGPGNATNGNYFVGSFNLGTAESRIPSDSNNIVVKFSDEIVQKMLEQHQSERRELGQIIYLIGFTRLLRRDQLLHLVDALAEMNSQDPLIYHYLLTCLAALDGDCTSPTEVEYTYLTELWNDISFMQSMTEKLTAKRWLVKQVKAVALLQWCLFLGSAYQQDPRIEQETQIWEEVIDQMVMTAIHNGAFPFMASDLLHFKKKDPFEESSAQILGPKTEDSLRVSTADDLLGIEEEFRPEVVSQMDRLMITFVTSLQSILRRLRNQEEDAHVSMQYHSLAQFSTSDSSDSLPSPPRHDIEALFEVIAAIHRDVPDSALMYWGVDREAETAEDPMLVSARSTKLTGFVRWASECRQLGMVQSFYEMLASLATGPHCSDLAYSFLMSGSSEDGPSGSNTIFGRIADGIGGINIPNCSWSSIFHQFQFYIQALQAFSQKSDVRESPQLTPPEVSILKGYARIIRQIVHYSPIAQATLYDHQKYRPIQTLFAMAACPISLDLKAELLLAIAAFSAPGNKISSDIARKCWLTLEHSQILSTNSYDLPVAFGLSSNLSNRVSSGNLTRTGILAELEEVEATNQVYPSSTAFIRLLVSLIHPPSHRSPLKKGEDLELQSIPDNLGIASRSLGIDPYVRFVIDEVFRKVGSRDFLHQEERYKVFEVCLAFIERSLASYELGSLAAAMTIPNAEGKDSQSRATFSVISHPGFEIMLRILNNTELTRQIFETLLNGPRFVENKPQKSDITCRCVLRALRIVKRVIDLQAIFIDNVLPNVLQHAAGLLPHERLIWARSAQSLDQHIFHSNGIVISIAVLVGCVEDDEVAYLAVKLLTHIAESTFFNAVDHFHGQYPGRMNRLLGLLDSSEESLLILGNFIGRLEAAASSFRDVDDDDLVVDSSGEPEERDMTRVQPAIRCAILDLLLQNTQPHRPAPNVAHYLLGFDVRSSRDAVVFSDPKSPDAKLSCFHTILNLLRLGHGARSIEENVAEFTLLERDAILAEKAYRLVRQLCLHDYSSKAVSRYLRTTERYFVTQADSLPFEISPNPSVTGGKLIFSNGQVIDTTCTAIVSTLHSSAWLLETISLELNLLTQHVRRDHASRLVTILFESVTSSDQSKSLLDQAGNPDQSLPKMQELFLHLDFVWKNNTIIEHRSLKNFGMLNFDQCYILDGTGCQLFDLKAILSLLGATRQEMKRRGQLSTTLQQSEIQDETKFVIESIVVENQRRMIYSAQYHMMRAWSTLLRLTLTRAFHLVPPDNRHVFLMDLLTSVLSKLLEGQLDSDSSELMGEIIVALMIKLRHEGTQLGSLAPGEAAQAFPFDRLLPILRSIIQSVVLSNNSNVLRGNLYAAILSFLQHVYTTSASYDFSTNDLQDLMKLSEDPPPLMDNSSTVFSQRNNSRSALEANTIAMFSTAFDRLLPVICRDAVMGSEVWKSVAFTALDSLLMLSDRSRSGAQFINVLWRNGFIKDFVDFLKDSEGDLLAVLEPDPESLNALYVYETQMAFLLRVASTKAGSEKLIESKLLSRLGGCNYLNGAPQALSSHLEFDTFIPSASDRYHQLLLPALQLITSVLVFLGPESTIVAKEALTFVNAQKEMIMTCLRSVELLTSSVGIQELTLISNLLRLALPVVGEQEMVSSTDFGAFHTGLLAVANTVCGGQIWVSNIQPSTDTERQDTLSTMPGSSSSMTIFQEQVIDLALALQSSILTYMRVATHRRARARFLPVMLPTLRNLESTSSLVGPGPTFATILNFLSDSSSLLELTLGLTTNLSHRLKNWGKTSREDVLEILSTEESSSMQEAEWKLKAKRKVIDAQNRSYSRSLLILDVIEMGLLLFWKNASHYLENANDDESVVFNDFKPTNSTYGFLLNSSSNNLNKSNYNRQTSLEVNLGEDCLNILRPIFQKLQSLNFVSVWFYTS